MIRRLLKAHLKFKAAAALGLVLVAVLLVVALNPHRLSREPAGRSSIRLPGERAVHAQASGWGGDSALLARVIMGEAADEPFVGQVAVGAVMMNRIRSPLFPGSLSGVVYQPLAFESVSNGLIWSRQPSATQYSAANMAISGWDPTFGALYFWNPSKPVSPWVWTRRIITYIGRHVFAR